MGNFAILATRVDVVFRAAYFWGPGPEACAVSAEFSVLFGILLVEYLISCYELAIPVI